MLTREPGFLSSIAVMVMSYRCQADMRRQAIWRRCSKNDIFAAPSDFSISVASRGSAASAAYAAISSA